MLAIRMQRTGRKGHAQFRVVVQDSRRTPTSGRVVAALGHFNPHTKTAVIDKEKAAYYLEHGAQPSDRVARLLKNEGVKLPTWVKLPTAKQGATRHAEKLRKNRPAEEAAPKEIPAEEPAAEAAEASAKEAPAQAEPAAAEEKPAK
ncbi:MAG TPA: 30S ribosomal protein S16 [Verrucomicrobiae bacterium]|nr:30S ribosomal protein S16 [Verrucomicrobiae bacterium]